MDAVFLKILNMSLIAVWLILAVILVRVLLQKAPKYIRCILWALVAIRLVCPFSIESAFSLLPAISETDTQEQEENEISQPSHETEEQTGDESNVVSDENSQTDEVYEPEVDVSVDEQNMDMVGDIESINMNIVTENIISIIWLFGMAVILTHSIISYVRLKKRVSTATNYDENIWVSDDVETPFILGVIKPRIYLPSGMDAEIKKYVLAHEYAHIRRKDHIWKPLGFVIACVHWFNPLVWVAYVLFSRDVEMACDEKVIKNLDVEERKAYSKALLACSASNKSISECPVAFSETAVKSRVKSVLNYKKTAFWIIIVSLIMCAAVAAGFLTSPKSDKEDNVYDAERSNAVSDSVYSSSNNMHVEKLPLEEINEYRDQMPSVDNIQSIDMIECIYAQNMLKRITDKNDIEMLVQMFSDVVIVRKAEPEETQLIGGYGTYFIIRTNNNETFVYRICSHDLMCWNDVYYLADIGYFDSVFKDENDLWSQFDYSEIFVGWGGLSEILNSDGKKELVKYEFTYSGNLETTLDIEEFKISIYPDGTYSYNTTDTVISSKQYEETVVRGQWSISDNQLMLIENAGEEDERVNYFRFDGFHKDDIIFLKEKSDGFAAIKVYDHERFYGKAVAE